MAVLLVAAVLVILPLAFHDDYALTLVTRMAVLALFALSYNLLYGETGLLSFGHALYFGAGAYAAVHAQNAWGAHGLPVTLLPLAGGVAGALVAVPLGWVSTRRGGLTFAMISLGIGELALALVPMLPSVFGGEGGVTMNRVTAPGLFGINYAGAVEVYALAAAWLAAAMAALYAFTFTPLGRMANAVRDNPERAAFLGCDPRAVRWRVMMLAGFTAGVAGALGAIQYEVATAESLGHGLSAAALIATILGGPGTFLGPVAGAVLYELISGALGSVTPAWPFYLGTLFIAVVLLAPGGIASLIAAAARGRHVATARGLALVAGTVALVAGLVGLVELIYLAAGRGQASALAAMLGLADRGHDGAAWLVALVLFASGALVCTAASRRRTFATSAAAERAA